MRKRFIMTYKQKHRVQGIIMNIKDVTDKTKFSGLQLCKLVGITHHQFQSFKLAGLIEYKSHYTLKDVIYVGITNNFRLKKHSWKTIKNIYIDVFKDLDFLKKTDFLKLDIILIDLSNSTYQFLPKHDVVGIDFNAEILNVLYNMETCNYCYLIYVNKVIDEIIANSKKIDLKVDVEKILLSA